MPRLYKPWETSGGLFGNLAVVGFLFVQCLDGIYTYMGVSLWGSSIEANPLIRTAVEIGGLGLGLGGIKVLAVALGMALHLRRIHTPVAVLTAIYLVAAILPWTFLFFSR